MKKIFAALSMLSALALMVCPIPGTAGSAGNRKLRGQTASGDPDLEARDGGGSSALAYAVRTDKGDLVYYLLQKGADGNTRDNMGRTPLIVASSTGSVNTMRELIGAGVDVDAQDSLRRSALGWAVEERHGDAVQLLSNHKAAPDAGDSKGVTP
jgi:ankyrin repeat protein